MLVSTAGVHPHHAKEYDERTLPVLKSLLAEPSVVAVGECGLDYDRDRSPRASQRECFADQLQLAVDLMLPVFLHERAAHEDFVAILRDFPTLGPAVVHCFTGVASELDVYLGRDLHIGITGFVCDQRRGQHVLDLVRRVPTNRLMIETDAPYMLPPGATGAKRRRNEPSFLPYVAEALASATGRTFDEIAHQTTAVAREFFQLGSRGEL
jgi:TatD DNase family protein